MRTNQGLKIRKVWAGPPSIGYPIGELNTLFKDPVKSPDAQAGTDRVLLILKAKIPHAGVEPTACA